MHPVLCHWAGLRDCYCLIRRYSNEEQEIYRTCKYHHIHDLRINTQHIPSIINFYFRETGTLESYVSENGNSLQKKRRNKKNWIIEYSSLPTEMLQHDSKCFIFRCRKHRRNPVVLRPLCVSSNIYIQSQWIQFLA